MSARGEGRVSIRSVRYLGTFPHQRTDTWAMVGQDGGQSIPVDGRSLFVFSDTLLAAAAGPRPSASPPPPALAHALGREGVFLANAAGMSSGDELRPALAAIAYFTDDHGFPREILPALERERLQQIRFWPEHGIEIDGVVHLFYLGIQTIDPTSLWGFRTLGVGLARLDPATGRCERLWRRGDWRLWKPLGEDFHLGVQVLPAGGWLYVFGSVRTGPFHVARVARVRPADLARPEAYEHFAGDGPRWSGDPGAAADLCVSSADFSVSYNPHLERYLMVHVDEYTKVLTLRTAPAPWGPWGDAQTITRVPHEPESEMVYLGFEHPDFAADAGRTIYVSYCQPRFRNNSLLTLTFR